MGRVGEDDVRAVPQEEAVGELLVDDSDVSGDDDGPARQAEGGDSVQHGLDATADEGEDDEVVSLVAHGVQELDGGDLADPLGVDPDLADLRELAGGRGGPAAQQQPADLDGVHSPSVPGGLGGQAARGERAPFPPGVGVGEDGDPERRSGGGGLGRFGLMAGTWGHVEEVRKAFRCAAQRDGNRWLTASRRLGSGPEYALNSRYGKGDSPVRRALFTSWAHCGKGKGHSRT